MVPETGHEAGIPHCYVSEGDIRELLKDFKIISLSKEQNFVRKERAATGIHFFVHIRKD